MSYCSTYLGPVSAEVETGLGLTDWSVLFAVESVAEGQLDAVVLVGSSTEVGLEPLMFVGCHLPAKNYVKLVDVKIFVNCYLVSQNGIS